MSSSVEIEIRFAVPSAARKALLVELTRVPTQVRRVSLAAMYLDTPDRRLADKGIAWRLRREGRRWVQTLKADGPNALERFEHEVARPGATPDASLHAGTPAGDRLLKLLKVAETDELPVGVCYRTEVRRVLRRVRTRGAVVELAYDEGRLLAGDPAREPAVRRICELEFELVSGSPVAMLAMAERWRKRFGLLLEPRSKAERGDRLASGLPFPALRKAADPDYPRDASVDEAFDAVLDECLDQILRNTVGLIDGDPALRVDHVHQLRVGIRRLRSGLRSFRNWVEPPPEALVDELRALFAILGQSRDAEIVDGDVAQAIAAAGSPPRADGELAEVPDPVAAVTAPAAQQLLLAWLSWRFGRVRAEPVVYSRDRAEPTVPSLVQAEPALRSRNLPERAARRLGNWHRAIVAEVRSFDRLDDLRLHTLRKRIKRQRYASGFFAPLLRRGTLSRYLKELARAQDRMGELNDLLVARDRNQARVDEDPGAWFALGWLAARIEVVKGRAGSALRKLARTEPPRA
ncbi:MAG: CHAD domain-containing protein [Burkholderiaceae bacterium]